MGDKKILIISSVFPPSSTSIGKRIGDLLSFFPKNNYIVLTNKISINSSDEFNTGKTFYFSGCVFFKNFHSNKVFKNLSKIIFYISQVIDIASKGLYLSVKNKTASTLIIADAGPCMLASVFLLVLSKKPIDFYFFDIYAKNPTLSKMAAEIAKHIQTFIIAKSRYLFFIWIDMQKYYSNLYPQFSFKMHTIPFSITLDKYGIQKYSSIHNNQSQKRLKICYAGIIDKPQIDVIRIFAQLLNRNKEWSLHLFTPHTQEEIKNLKGIGIVGNNIFFDYVSGNKIIDKYREADILLFPFSFENKMKIMVATMVGGKVIEYLASGVPTIVVAPKDAAISAFFTHYNLGIVVNELSLDIIEEKLNDFLHQRELYQNLAANGQRIARELFNAETNCKMLSKFLLTQ